MQFREFEQHFKNHQLISVQAVKNAFQDYNRRQLSQWEDKNWLIRLRQGQYLLASHLENLDKELLANEMKNSYISTEYALNRLNLIPEVPQKITSVTIERSEAVKTPVGEFIYRHIKPKLFTGYELISAQAVNRQIRLATPTKALFDWVYLNDQSFEDTRLNPEVLQDGFDQNQFQDWCQVVANPAILRRLKSFLNVIKNYA